MEYIETLVVTDSNPSKLVSPSKENCCQWIQAGLDYFREKELMVEKSFLVCGITNALDGSENFFIHCAKQLPNLELPYINESDEDPFQSSDDDTNDSDNDDIDTDESAE